MLGEPFRLAQIRDVCSSPVGAAGRIYVTSRDGVTQVMSHEAMPKMLATNRLDDSISASAAIVGRELFLRGEKRSIASRRSDRRIGSSRR